MGQHVVLSLGDGCDSGATFTTTGDSVAVTGHEPAPLPGSGDNEVQITAVRLGKSVVHVHGNRACSTEGVTKGMCFGSDHSLPDVRFDVVVAPSSASSTR